MHPFRTGKDRVNVIVLPALRLITANCHPFKWKTFGRGGGGHPCRLNHPPDPRTRRISWNERSLGGEKGFRHSHGIMAFWLWTKI